MTTCRSTSLFRGQRVRCALSADHRPATLHADGSGFVWDDEVDVIGVGQIVRGYADGFEAGYRQAKEEAAAASPAAAPPTQQAMTESERKNCDLRALAAELRASCQTSPRGQLVYIDAPAIRAVADRLDGLAAPSDQPENKP